MITNSKHRLLLLVGIMFMAVIGKYLAIRDHRYFQAGLFFIIWVVTTYVFFREARTGRPYIAYDKRGFPVEMICNRPITNLLRVLIHTDILMTWIKNRKPFNPYGGINYRHDGCSGYTQDDDGAGDTYDGTDEDDTEL